MTAQPIQERKEESVQEKEESVVPKARNEMIFAKEDSPSEELLISKEEEPLESPPLVRQNGYYKLSENLSRGEGIN